MKIFSTNLLATLLTGLSAFAIGCVVSVGGDTDAGTQKECGAPFSNSVVVGDTCYCEAGYTWCNPNAADDYTCCEEEGKTGTCEGANLVPDPNNANQCVCDQGYDWCNPADPNDLSCCESMAGGTSGTTTDGTTSAGGETETETGAGTTTTGPEVCEDAQEPPATCDPDTELAFCTHPESCGPEGSKYYVCLEGAWVEQGQTEQDKICKLDGHDFSAGCVDDGSSADLFCGDGPGTPCTTGEPDSCGDVDTLLYCTYGKQSALSCLDQCQNVGDRQGITYDYGECGEQDGEIVCLCCDFEEEGCGPGDTGG